jgi:AcrR family transcriptional regulator
VTQSTRGQRQRRALVGDIVEEARRQLEAGGPSGISLRAVARAVGMSAPSLYTYFPSLSHLYTELISQSYRDLAAAVEGALRRTSKADLEARLLAGPRAYRRWSLSHRQQFNLIFFDQISGYQAPPEGPTVEAQTMALRPIAAAYAAACQRTVEELSADDDLLDEFLGWWGAFHGLVALEVNHHLDWRQPNRIFERHLTTSVAHLLEQGRAPTPQTEPKRRERDPR